MKWVGWRIDVMAKNMIFDVMLHFLCPWFNMIWMRDSYFIALLLFGMPTIMKRSRLVLKPAKIS
jgi:hypothetical protein